LAADQLSRVFSALADPTRRDMVTRLADGDATVNELAEPYDVTLQAVSKHLKVLEDAGLVSRSRRLNAARCTWRRRSSSS
jgi:DNA-binding transcriptional ArsR family regulator